MSDDLTVYLSGEIHSDWRARIRDGVAAAGLDVTLLAPVTDHATSDEAGVAILGAEADDFWRDHKGAKLNAIRTRTLIERADVVVVRFGDKYRQWNAAFGRRLCRGAGHPGHHAARHRARPRTQGSRRRGAGHRRDARAVVRLLAYVVKGEL